MHEPLTTSTTPRASTPDPFDTDTAVTKVATDRYDAVLSRRWDRLGGGPLGGYTLAVTANALSDRMRAEAPVVLSAFFLRRAHHGAAEVRTEVLRTGQRLVTGRAALRQFGRDVVAVTATYGAPTAGARTAVFADPPRLPDVDACIDPLDGLALDDVTIRDRVEYRFPSLPGWRYGEGSGNPSGEFWMRLVGVDHHRPAHLPLLVDAAAPMVLELGEFASTTLELTVHLRAEPEPGWLACRAATRFVAGGFHEEDFEIWDSSGTLVAQSRQLALLT